MKGGTNKNRDNRKKEAGERNLIICLLFAVTCLLATSAMAAPKNLRDILAASVEVGSSGGLGSGVVIASPLAESRVEREEFRGEDELSTPNSQLPNIALVLTTYHLVSAPEGPILVSGRSAKVIGYDPANDLALLQVTGDRKQQGENSHQLPARAQEDYLPALSGLPLAQEMPKIGARLYIFGNALGAFADTFSEALLVNTDRMALGIKVWQVTGLAFPGQSGGAVVNEQGQLVGLLSMVVAGTPGLSFIIPLPTIRDFLKTVESWELRVEGSTLNSRPLTPKLEGGNNDPLAKTEEP